MSGSEKKPQLSNLSSLNKLDQGVIHSQKIKSCWRWAVFVNRFQHRLRCRNCPRVVKILFASVKVKVWLAQPKIPTAVYKKCVYDLQSHTLSESWNQTSSLHDLHDFMVSNCYLMIYRPGRIYTHWVMGGSST